MEKVKKAVWSMDAPWEPKTGGRRAFPTKAEIMCAMPKVRFGFGYHSMESHLRSRPDLSDVTELKKAPSKTVISDSLKRIPMSYLGKTNAKLAEPIKKKDIAPDSSGFGAKRCEAWLGIKTNTHKSGKPCLKPRILVAIQSMAVASFGITTGTRGDAPVLKKLIKGIPKGIGDFCADPACLSRDICNTVAALQKIPYIKPRKNAVRNSKGSASWKKMAALFQGNQDEFDRHYHKRYLWSQHLQHSKESLETTCHQKNKLIRRKELALRAICYDIRVVNLMEIAKHVRG